MAKNKKDRRSDSEPSIERDDKITLSGVIEEALPSTLFKVKCEGGLMVLCTLGGKLRVNRIRLLVGDSVNVEVSPYDTSRGRVVWRGRQ